MNNNASRSFSYHFPLTVLVIPLFFIYLKTLAPSLTWANGGNDGGDLIAAAYTGGIAHPSGYPLYLLLARLFQFLPIGSLAYRTNLMSMVAAICSAVLIYRFVVRALESTVRKFTWLAGLTAGFAFGLSPLVWSQAVITEVYTLHAFLIVLTLYLSTYSLRNMAPKFLESIRGLVFGLAMGNHVTTFLLMPLLLFSGNIRTDDHTIPQTQITKLRFSTSSLIRQLVWFSIGLSLYLTLPLRALANPPVNWGNPITLKRFWWLVSGELYQSYYLQFQLDGIDTRLQAWAALLIQQFGLPGVILGITGLIFFFKPSRLYLYTIWTALIYSLFAILYSSSDSYVYLIPLYIVFAIWIGLAFGNGLDRFTPRSNLLRLTIGILCIGFFLVHGSGYFNQVDASHDSRAEMFGRQVMSKVPQDALIFAKGDPAVFSLWHFHFALNERPDISVIADDLLQFDWYQESLQSTYPSLILPQKAPWPQAISIANPEREICFVQYSDRTEIDCNR